MKKQLHGRIITFALALFFVLALLPMGVIIAETSSAGSQGYETLDSVIRSKSLIPNPKFIKGGKSSDGESAKNLFDNSIDTKYCGETPYWVEWKYNYEYVVDRFVFATANDNTKYPRRMGDGWTLSGSENGETWKVIYTGKATDYKNTDKTFYYVDLPDNKETYQYYRLDAKNGADDNFIQLSMVALCVKRKSVTGYKTLTQAAKGKTLISNAQFIKGGKSIAGFDEKPEYLFDGTTDTKYCGRTPYWVEWKYEQAYIADRFIFATANDNVEYPRRMDSGWTLSGSKDGKSWETIYTGTVFDYENENKTFYYVDLSDNKEAYQYYRLDAKNGGADYNGWDKENKVVQLSIVALCGTPAK